MIGCEDRIRNDLCCFEWGVKLYSNQPTPMAVRLAADLSPSADGSAVRTSLVADQLQAASVSIAYAAAPRSQRAIAYVGTDRRTDGSQYRLMRVYGGA